MHHPVPSIQAIPSPTVAQTCPLCDRHAASFVADHRGLPRRQLRYGYACDCAGRFTVPAEEELLLRRRDKIHRGTVALAVRRAWMRGLTVNLDAVTFRRLLLEETVA